MSKRNLTSAVLIHATAFGIALSVIDTGKGLESFHEKNDMPTNTKFDNFFSPAEYLETSRKLEAESSSEEKLTVLPFGEHLSTGQ